MSTSKDAGRPRGAHHTYVQNHGQLDSSNRRSCECVYCSFRYESMRPEQVYTHILDHCKAVPEEIRTQAFDELAKRGPGLTGPQRKRSRTTELRETDSPSRSSGSSIRQFTPSAGNVPPGHQKELDSLYLRALVHAGIPFNAAENPFVIDLLQTLRPRWKVPGTSCKLHTPVHTYDHLCYGSWLK